MGFLDKLINFLASFIQKTWKYDIGIAIALSAVLSLLLWYKNRHKKEDNSESDTDELL